MAISYELVRALASGHFRSGEELAQELGITRNAVWKRIDALRDLGLDVHAVRGRGYRLAQPLELLAPQSILDGISHESRSLLAELEILDSVDSTNSYVMARRKGGTQHAVAVFAERQQAGRGRRGRQWVSPFGSNLYFSLLWRFDPAPAQLQALGLAAAVMLAKTINSRFDRDVVRVKWPNDLYCGTRKLAGILLELSGEAGGQCHVVIGVGVNVAMPRTSAETIDQPWTDLSQAFGRDVSRNSTASAALEALLLALRQFESAGFASFLPDWRRLDYLGDKDIMVYQAGKQVVGRALGIDAAGALMVQVGERQERFFSGDVTVRVSKPVQD